MNNIGLSFLLTTIAGLSTLFGLILIFIKVKNQDKIIVSSLAFAAGVMICVSITDLIPESLSMLNGKFNGFFQVLICFIFVLFGIIVSNVLDQTLPNNINDNNKLYRVGIISMIAIILHNIPEGIVTFISTTKDTSLGLSLTIAIALHNIPEGISIGIPIYYGTKSKKKAFIYTLISAMSEPLGALLAYLFLAPFINDIVLGILFAIIAGIMIQIAFFELIVQSRSYHEKALFNLFFILGIIFMLLKFIF